jgi:glycosyltransferase involved in cell wall biosynthesis
MNILHLTTFLQGGAGRVLVDLASAQRRRGHHVTVVAARTPVPGYGHYDDFIAQLAHAGVGVWLVDSLFHRDMAQNLRAAELVNRVSAMAPPDVVHAHAAVPSLIALLSAGHRRRPVRIVQTMHGWGVSKTPAQAEADVRVMNLVDRVVVPSVHAAKELTTLGADPSLIQVIAYGVSRDRTSLAGGDAVLAAELASRRRRGNLVIACVGTIGARKNQALLVDALTRIDRSLDIFAVFVGDGDRAGLANHIARAGLDARAAVRGYTAGARALARQADILVLPSESEGQPLAVLEAFADRVLVVASDIPALAELVDDERTGFLHRAGDAASLADVIARVHRLPARLREAIIERAATEQSVRFSADAMYRNYMDAYAASARETAALRQAV